jgi:hypothetical protein
MRFNGDQPGPYDKLLQALSCPIDWQPICSDYEFVLALDFLWFATVRAHQVDKESSFFSHHNWLLDQCKIGLLVDESEIDRILATIETWKCDANNAYVKEWQRFSQLGVASPLEYRKHYMQWAASDAEVAAASASRNVGVLFPRFSAQWQRPLVWAALSETWIRNGGLDSTPLDDAEYHARVAKFKSIFGREHLHVLAMLTFPIGCVTGKPSKVAHLDFDFSTPLVHMYPDTVREFEEAEFAVDIPGGDFSPDGAS